MQRFVLTIIKLTFRTYWRCPVGYLTYFILDFFFTDVNAIHFNETTKFFVWFLKHLFASLAGRMKV
jgi:hypothetical protein